MPSDFLTAVFPVLSCQRRTITSTYFGSSSISLAARPDFSAAIKVMLDPPKQSRAIRGQAHISSPGALPYLFRLFQINSRLAPMAMSSVELAQEVGEDFERILDHLARHEVEDPVERIREIIEALNVLELNPRTEKSTPLALASAARWDCTWSSRYTGRLRSAQGWKNLSRVPFEKSISAGMSSWLLVAWLTMSRIAVRSRTAHVPGAWLPAPK
jgi:hypothetical protein